MKFLETLKQTRVTVSAEETRDIIVAMINQGFFNEERTVVYIDKQDIGAEMLLQNPVDVLDHAWQICRQDGDTISPQNLGKIIEDGGVKIYTLKDAEEGK